MSTTIELTLTLEQAQALSDACNLYARVSLGQLDQIAQLVLYGEIKTFSSNDADSQIWAIMEAEMERLRFILGYPDGASLGINNNKATASVRRNFEIKQVLDEVIVKHRWPDPDPFDVRYAGLNLRITTDPAPVAVIKEHQE
jgi:hypothetical protein